VGGRVFSCPLRRTARAKLSRAEGRAASRILCLWLLPAGSSSEALRVPAEPPSAHVARSGPPAGGLRRGPTCQVQRVQPRQAACCYKGVPARAAQLTPSRLSLATGSPLFRVHKAGLLPGARRAERGSPSEWPPSSVCAAPGESVAHFAALAWPQAAGGPPTNRQRAELRQREHGDSEPPAPLAVGVHLSVSGPCRASRATALGSRRASEHRWAVPSQPQGSSSCMRRLLRLAEGPRRARTDVPLAGARG